MNMYIPEIGDVIKLNSNWTFKLYKEFRNSSLYKYFFDEELESYNSSSEQTKYKEITLDKDTLLMIDRIYIRKGSSDFSSISFKIKNQKNNLRFWAKLNDVNNIDFDLIYLNNINEEFNNFITLIKEDKVDVFKLINSINKENKSFEILYENKTIFVSTKINQIFGSDKINYVFSFDYKDFDNKKKIFTKSFTFLDDEVLYDKLNIIYEYLK